MTDQSGPAAELNSEVIAASREVDRTMLRWFRSLSMRERLRVCAQTTKGLRKFRRVQPRAG